MSSVGPDGSRWLIAQRWKIAALGSVIALLIWMAGQSAPIVDHVLQPSAVNHDSGLAYAASLPARDDWLYYVRSDGQDGPDVSQLELFENGRLLGPQHAPHDEIRQIGGGRYSHWNGQLWFSASDASDPRTNGRTYLSQVKKSLMPVWILVGVLGGAAAALVLTYTAIAALTSISSDSRVLAVLRRLASSVMPFEPSRAITLTSVAVGGIAGGLAVLLGWHFGDVTTTGLGVARYFPVSDALGYHQCATSIAALGHFEEAHLAVWCSRRAIYPSMLAGLFAIADWNSQLALVIQGVVTGASITAFGLVLALTFSPLVALVSVGILSVYAWEFVFGLYMTEVSGFVLGIAGLTLLISYSGRRRVWQLFAGVTFLSIGITARAGAVSVLPALVAWSAIANRGMSSRERTRLVIVAALAAAIGPVLQVILAIAFGADPGNTGGNFSTSLYGLSTGSRDWSQAYRDFAPLFAQSEPEAFRHIYSVAITNIVERPTIFIAALADAGHGYVITLFEFGALAPYSSLLSAIVVLGIARCLFSIENTLSRLALAVGLAELLVAPLIIDSGGTRVFAATSGVRVLLFAIGAQWILSLLFSRFVSVRYSPSNDRWSARAATAVAALVLIVTLLPATPIGRAAIPDFVQGSDCPVGLVEVVARVGRETQYMVISDDTARVHSVIPFVVGAGRLRADTRLASTWFGRDFLELIPPITILRAVNLASTNRSAVKPLFFRGVLSDLPTPQSMCVDPSSSIELAGAPHFEVKSVLPLAGAKVE